AAEEATAKCESAATASVDLQEALNREKQRADRLDEQLQAIGAAAGKGWERPIPAGAPAFVPLGHDRRCRIVSILGLKGGGGKTTLTLTLAATLGEQKQRVLMIDCDHQRSLSAMCLRQSRRKELHEARLTLQHFLLGKDRTPETFGPCIQELPNVPFC